MARDRQVATSVTAETGCGGHCVCSVLSGAEGPVDPGAAGSRLHGGHVRGRRQRLRGAEGGSRRGVAVRGRSERGQSLHLKATEHQLCTRLDPVS